MVHQRPSPRSLEQQIVQIVTRPCAVVFSLARWELTRSNLPKIGYFCTWDKLVKHKSTLQFYQYYLVLSRTQAFSLTLTVLLQIPGDSTRLNIAYVTSLSKIARPQFTRLLHHSLTNSCPRRQARDWEWSLYCGTSSIYRLLTDPSAFLDYGPTAIVVQKTNHIKAVLPQMNLRSNRPYRKPL